MILNEVLGDFVKMSKILEEKDQRIKELEQQLAIYKRALELACDYTESEWGNEYDPDYFLQQAKKELEEQDVKD